MSKKKEYHRDRCIQSKDPQVRRMEEAYRRQTGDMDPAGERIFRMYARQETLASSDEQLEAALDDVDAFFGNLRHRFDQGCL